MKIYQTTVQQFRINPVTDTADTVVPETMDINDHIILNSSIDAAITDHTEWVNIFGDKDIFFITDLETNTAIDDEDLHCIHIVTTIEHVTDDYITKTIIETITREV